jgi:hypothetical protein
MPDLLHGADRQPHRPRHRAARPMGGLARRRSERPRDQLPDDRLGDWRFTGLARLLVQQPVDAGFHEPALPAPHAGFGDPGPAHNLRRAAAFGRSQDDLRPPYMFLGTVVIGNDCMQPFPIPGPSRTSTSARILRCCHRTRSEGILCFDHTALMSAVTSSRQVNSWLCFKRMFQAVLDRAGGAAVVTTVDHPLMRGSEPHDR